MESPHSSHFHEEFLRSSGSRAAAVRRARYQSWQREKDRQGKGPSRSLWAPCVGTGQGTQGPIPWGRLSQDLQERSGRGTSGLGPPGLLGEQWGPGADDIMNEEGSGRRSEGLAGPDHTQLGEGSTFLKFRG